VVETFPLSKAAIQEVGAYFSDHKLKFMVNVGDKEEWYAGGQFPEKVCSLCIPELAVSQADEIITALKHIPDIVVQKPPSFTGDKVWASVTSSVATKLHCVIEITKLLHIHPDEVIGVGDGYNDYPLLSACGLKIAMGNAVPELKAIADFIAPSVDEDGVATVIEKFLLT
jgi:hydroxymethylpyrimidine pyrophosphatase-like HAD family hydrolase